MCRSSIWSLSFRISEQNRVIYLHCMLHVAASRIPDYIILIIFAKRTNYEGPPSLILLNRGVTVSDAQIFSSAHHTVCILRYAVKAVDSHILLSSSHCLYPSVRCKSCRFSSSPQLITLSVTFGMLCSL
jgi:hypothetical protein